jgi:hypothetical protein
MMKCVCTPGRLAASFTLSRLPIVFLPFVTFRTRYILENSYYMIGADIR